MAIPLIVPGLRGSGPDHWQTWLEAQLPGAQRVQQADWEVPDLLRWSIAVANHIGRLNAPIVLVGHSFGALAAALAGSVRSDWIEAAFLVAPADPVKFGATHLLPRRPLPFPSMVVASTNDPWVSHEVARGWAARWGSRFVSVGPMGHINADSGHGPWPQGLALLGELPCAPRAQPDTPRRSAHCGNSAALAA
jgi:predicted alpha/beta hydrolase family esterase